jgi:hypothetical protein
MKIFFLVAIAAVFAISALPGCGCAEPPADGIPPIFAYDARTPAKKTMRPFSSEDELKSFLKELAENQRRQRRDSAKNEAQAPVSSPMSSNGVTALTASADKDDSVTNVQHPGVDEGGIVKVHGDYLVVLRRGRLFTVKIGDGALRPISAVDAFGPDINPASTWYDEMLVSENTIAVIGYSYERGGTEIGLFQIDEAGKLSYTSTHHLRSNDYYSSRNYASRLIGSKLIFYTPLYLNPGADDPFQNFPAARRWHKGASREEFKRIVSAANIYRAEQPLNPDYGLALHTVTVCDLSAGRFECKATAVLGPPGRVFYVSPESVYVWVNSWMKRDNKMSAESMVYRMPLDGSGPTALRVSGTPVDQFSFLESQDGHLNVLVRSNSVGDGMWGAEVAAGDVALLRTSLMNFSDGRDAAPPSNYRKLPKPAGYTFQNRFVGNYLLYGTGSGWGYPQNTAQSLLYAVQWVDGRAQTLSLNHGVDRIEQMGSDAVVVGTDGKDLHFTSIYLGSSAGIVDRYTRKGASQGELRSHGFFYKPEGTRSGTLGLPISVPGRPGYRHLFDSSAAILFLRNNSLHFEEVGELSARSEAAVDDACRASCVDWYGNARPLFVRGRVLALLGYEIVEGSLSDGRMRELRRVSYAPGPVEITRQ